jgi:hypothetical protein
MYEFLTTGVFVAGAVFLLVLIRRNLRFLGAFVIGLAIIMLVAASGAFWTPVGHLPQMPERHRPGNSRRRASWSARSRSRLCI